MKKLKKSLGAVGWCIFYAATLIGTLYAAGTFIEKDMRNHPIRLAPSPANLQEIYITPLAGKTYFVINGREWYSESDVPIEYEEPLRSVVQFYLSRKPTNSNEEYIRYINVFSMINIETVVRSDTKVVRISLAENPR